MSEANTNMFETNYLFNCFNVDNKVKYNGHPHADLFLSKKLSRFIFPSKDTLDPSWVQTPVPPFEALTHLINMSWTRLTNGEVQVWSEMCGRRIQDKEVSELGLHKTEHDLRKARTEFKRDQQRLLYIDKKKIINKVIIKGLILSQNKIVQGSDDDFTRENLKLKFKNDKFTLNEILDECLTVKFSKSTTKKLKRFKHQLTNQICSAPNARYFINCLSNCIGAIRSHSAQ